MEDETNKLEKKEKINNILFSISSIAYFIIFMTCTMLLARYILNKNIFNLGADWNYAICNGVLYTLGLFVPLVIFVLVFKTKISFHFFKKGNVKSLLKNLLLSLLFGVTLQFVGMGISGLTALIIKSNTATDFASELGTVNHPLLLCITIAIFPAVMEELVFRGIIFKNARKKFSAIISALISGFAFGIYHLDIQQFAYAFILGIGFALIYEKTKNIFDVIIIHFVIDFSQLYLALGILNMQDVNVDEALDDTTTVYSTIVMCIMLLLIFVPISISLYKKYNSCENNLEIENK